MLAIFVYGNPAWTAGRGEPWGPTEIDESTLGHLSMEDSQIYHQALTLIQAWSQAPSENYPERMIFLTTSHGAWVRKHYQGKPAPRGPITGTILLRDQSDPDAVEGPPIATAVFWDRVISTSDPLAQLLLWLPGELYVSKYIAQGPFDSDTIELMRLHGALAFLRELRAGDGYMSLPLKDRIALDLYTDGLKNGLRYLRQRVRANVVSRACEGLLGSADN